MNTLNGEFVMVPVPQRFYPAVIKALADAQAAEQGDRGALAVVDARGAWTLEQVRKLRGMLDNPTMLALMNLTCQRPGTPISFVEVCEHAGRQKAKAQADLAHFTKLIKLHFNTEGNWPVTPHPAGADGSISYEATTEVAAAWQEG
jgi:hypothetical protein